MRQDEGSLFPTRSSAPACLLPASVTVTPSHWGLSLRAQVAGALAEAGVGLEEITDRVVVGRQGHGVSASSDREGQGRSRGPPWTRSRSSRSSTGGLPGAMGGFPGNSSFGCVSRSFSSITEMKGRRPVSVKRLPSLLLLVAPGPQEQSSHPLHSSFRRNP